MAPAKLWGTFSVADHLRERPFVADVLLYDQLVVPVPDGQDELERWSAPERGWRPERQRELLEILGDLAVQVPWNQERRAQFARRAAPDTAEQAVEAALRDDVAGAVAFDVGAIARAREHAPPPPPGDPDPDDPAQMTTRLVLRDEWLSRRDKALLAGIRVDGEIEPVVAYGSYDELAGERGDIAPGRPDGPMPVALFEWSFLAPDDPQRSPDDLLRQAVELARHDEIAAWRAAVQTWRADALMKGWSDAESVERMEAMLAEYKAAAARSNIRVGMRCACVVVSAVAGVIASLATGTPAALAGATGAGVSVGSQIGRKPIPKQLEAAALFHQARRRFG